MLDLTFYTRQNQISNIEVSEKVYEKLAKAGLASEVNYSERKLVIEDEEYEVNVVVLNFDNRVKLLSLLEKERQLELEILFKSMEKSPTIKEVRENFDYVKTITEMYSMLKNEDILYFSYE